MIQDATDGVIKNLLQSSLRQGGTLDVLEGADLVGEGLAALKRHWLLVLLSQFFDGSFVRAKIELGSDQNERHARGVVGDLRPPLALDIIKTRKRRDGETDEEDISLGVRERTQAVVIFLSSGIPKPKVDGNPVHHYIGGVVVENRGNVLPREGIGCVTDEEARFTDGSVSDLEGEGGGG